VVKMRTVKLLLISVLIVLVAIGFFTSCQSSEKTGLSISLVETGEVVLTDGHIKSYDWQTHTIELNEKGVQQWNSFHTYETIPKLNQTLFGKDFVVKLGSKKLYQGKFYSGASSASYSGIVILEALFKLDSDPNTIRRNTVQIAFGFPTGGFSTGDDPRNNPELLEYLTARGLLK
jgi:hypothetical protein